jgi:hypothetical protein
MSNICYFFHNQDYFFRTAAMSGATLLYKSLSHNRWALQIFLSSDYLVTRGIEPTFPFFHAGDAQLCSRNKIFILYESWNYTYIWDCFIEFLVPSNLSFKITTLINPFFSYIIWHLYFSLTFPSPSKILKLFMLSLSILFHYAWNGRYISRHLKNKTNWNKFYLALNLNSFWISQPNFSRDVPVPFHPFSSEQ